MDPRRPAPKCSKCRRLRRPGGRYCSHHHAAYLRRYRADPRHSARVRAQWRASYERRFPGRRARAIKSLDAFVRCGIVGVPNYCGECNRPTKILTPWFEDFRRPRDAVFVCFTCYEEADE